MNKIICCAIVFIIFSTTSAPLMPSSDIKKAYAEDHIYVTSFESNENRRSFGNLEKYPINKKYEAGKVMLKQIRNIYTYTGKTPYLTNPANLFTASNPHLTPAMFGVDTEQEKEELIEEVYETRKYPILGNIINSEHTIAEYIHKRLIFVGSNDGMLHCFDLETLKELWAFIPYDRLISLSLSTNRNHDYFINPSPAIFENESEKIILFGKGEGDAGYYALDITTYDSPVFLYDINENYLGDTGEKLGESSGKPAICKIKISEDTSENIFLIPGGYDANNSRGRALFGVNISSKALSGIHFDYSNFSEIEHSITDASCFDHDGDGIESRIYAGDLGGDLFAIRDDDNNGNTDGTWNIIKLFSAPVEKSVSKKIFYAPEAGAETFGEYLFFGTGDMAYPYRTDIINRFYAVKNEWNNYHDELTENDLVDLTDNLIRNESSDSIENKKGWYIKLQGKGEKMAGSPILFGGYIYFTTYTPDTELKSESSGEARLYILGYKTGSPAGYSKDKETEASEIIGTGIPSAPRISILKKQPLLDITIGNKIITKEPVATPALTKYFWRRLD